MEAQQERPVRQQSRGTGNKEAQRWSRERQANHEKAWDEYFSRQRQANPQWQRERAEAAHLSVALPPKNILYPAQPRPSTVNVGEKNLELLDTSNDDESAEAEFGGEEQWKAGALQTAEGTTTNVSTQETNNPFRDVRPIPNLTQPSQEQEQEQQQQMHGTFEDGDDEDPIGPFEILYRDSGNSKAVLFAGALGLKADDTPNARIIDWLDEPYNSMLQSSAIPKVKAHLIEEVKRQRLAMGWSQKKSKNAAVSVLLNVASSYRTIQSLTGVTLLIGYWSKLRD